MRESLDGDDEQRDREHSRRQSLGTQSHPNLCVAPRWPPPATELVLSRVLLLASLSLISCSISSLSVGDAVETAQLPLRCGHGGIGVDRTPYGDGGRYLTYSDAMMIDDGSGGELDEYVDAVVHVCGCGGLPYRHIEAVAGGRGASGSVVAAIATPSSTIRQIVVGYVSVRAQTGAYHACTL